MAVASDLPAISQIKKDEPYIFRNTFANEMRSLA
jgi:hypothetical protein